MQVNVFFMHAILHRDCDMFNIVLLVLFSEGQKFSHKNQNYFRRSELFIKGFLYFSHDHISDYDCPPCGSVVSQTQYWGALCGYFKNMSKKNLAAIHQQCTLPTNSIENKQPNTDIKLNIKETESCVRDTNNLENK